MTKDRERLEKVFWLGIATMVGYWKNEEGQQELLCLPIYKEIDDWVSPDHSTYGSGEGKIISMNIFSKDSATVTFDFGRQFLILFNE